MTNQSELECRPSRVDWSTPFDEWLIPILNRFRYGGAIECRAIPSEIQLNIERYITANYTPNSEVMKLRLENAAKLANLDQKITHLEADVAERERVVRINVYKNILKSYPKKNRTMNDLSKLTRADIDRRIAELTKDQL